MAKKTPNGVIPSGPQAHTAQVASTAGDASSFVESAKKFFSGIVDTDMSSVRGAYERYKSGGYKIPNSTNSAPTSGTGTGESSPSDTPSQPDNSVKSTHGVIKDTEPSSKAAGSTSQRVTNVPTIDFFSMLGLKEFDPATATTNEDNYGAFLPIIIKNSAIFETDVINENSKVKNFSIKLPWAISEISDSVSVNYSRRLGTENTLAQEIVNIASSKLANTSFGQKMENFIDNLTTWFIASYDAKSLNKTLQLDFVLPITTIPQGKEKDFVVALRMALGTLQGLVYPRSHGFGYPPVVKVTCGGIYQNFKGFVESVRLTFSEVMIPVGEYMLPSVINGSISFKNIYMYTWDTEVALGSAANEFSLSAHPQLLFGVGSQENGTHFENATAGNFITFQNNTWKQYDYYTRHSTYAQLRRQEELEKIEKGIRHTVIVRVLPI